MLETRKSRGWVFVAAVASVLYTLGCLASHDWSGGLVVLGFVAAFTGLGIAIAEAIMWVENGDS